MNGTIASRETVAAATLAVEFAVEGAPIAYRPGQTIDVTLLEPRHTDAEGDTRTFSIAGAPGRPTLLIATRVRGSAFKRSLMDAEHDSPVTIEGPSGSFTLPNRAQPVFLLAGGIGVTPFRAMVEDAIERQLEHRIVLVHSNRTPEETPWLRELTGWSTENANFHYLPIMTRAADAREPWNGERRRLDRDLLAEILPADRDTPLYYVAGPARFVTGATTALRETGVDEDRIRAEDFPGY